MLRCPFPHAPKITMEYNSCGLCGSDRSEPFSESYDYEYQTCSNIWKFVKCLNCSCVYLNPRPDRKSLESIYPPNYYAYNYNESITAVARRAKEWLDTFTFRSILKELELELSTFLDIGCGNGRYLKAMEQRGLSKQNIYGIELHGGIARELCDEGFQVFATPFEEVNDLPEGEFELITLFSVLEHLAKPHEILLKVKNLLKPGGLLVFEVPNIESVNAHIFRNHYWGGYHTPRHWHFFSQTIIKDISRLLGYKIKRIKMTTGHSFWLWSVHHYFRYSLGWDRIGKLLNPGKCLPGLVLMTAIDLVRARFMSQTDNMLVFLEKL